MTTFFKLLNPEKGSLALFGSRHLSRGVVRLDDGLLGMLKPMTEHEHRPHAASYSCQDGARGSQEGMGSYGVTFAYMDRLPPTCMS